MTRQRSHYIFIYMSETTYVNWLPSFSSGVAVIDEQHKELLKLTNELFYHCVGNPDDERAYFQKIIKCAVDYVKVHFSTEEQIMKKTNFPGYLAHKKEHEKFILSVLEHARAFEDDKKLSLISFTSFLKNWILSHIAISDKQYFFYIKKIATRKDDGTLSITKSDIA